MCIRDSGTCAPLPVGRRSGAGDRDQNRIADERGHWLLSAGDRCLQGPGTIGAEGAPLHRDQRPSRGERRCAAASRRSGQLGECASGDVRYACLIFGTSADAKAAGERSRADARSACALDGAPRIPRLREAADGIVLCGLGQWFAYRGVGVARFSGGHDSPGARTTGRHG